MDFDAAWDTWMAAGHGDCGGWKYDPGPAVIRCACGTAIPVPARHQTAAAGASTRNQQHGTDPAPAAAGAEPPPGAQPLPPLLNAAEAMPDPAPGYEWYREMACDG